MQIDDQPSENVEDRRGMGGGGGTLIGGGLGAIVIAVAAMFFGVDPRLVLGLLDTAQQMQAPSQSPQGKMGAPQDAGGRFIANVLADTDDTWGAIFSAGGRQYVRPTVVLYENATQTACGTGQSAMGPFYCPSDRKVYLDLGFFDELASRFQAPGQFAQAYVLAHEIGHHVQNQLGTMDKMQAMRGRLSESQNNALSVRVELQADCFAGVWAHNAKRTHLEPGDIEGGLRAASAVGDDTIQRRTQGRVVPDSFTHGSAAQRTHWFQQGYQIGTIEACNTFDAKPL